jgi:hypothetical protein
MTDHPSEVAVGMTGSSQMFTEILPFSNDRVADGWVEQKTWEATQPPPG